MKIENINHPNIDNTTCEKYIEKAIIEQKDKEISDLKQCLDKLKKNIRFMKSDIECGATTLSDLKYKLNTCFLMIDSFENKE